MSPSLSFPSAVEVDGEAAFSVAERTRKEGEEADDDDDGRERTTGMRLLCCRSATDPPAAPRAPVCAVARCIMPGFVEKGGAVVSERQR